MYKLTIFLPNVEKKEKTYVVVLEGVPVTTVHHQYLALTLLPQCFLSDLDALSVVVWAFATTPKDDKAVLIASCTGDGCKTLLGYTHEVVRARCGKAGINGNSKRTVCAVFETNREGDTGGKLTVKLRFSGTSTNGGKRETVCKELD